MTKLDKFSKPMCKQLCKVCNFCVLMMIFSFPRLGKKIVLEITIKKIKDFCRKCVLYELIFLVLLLGHPFLLHVKAKWFDCVIHISTYWCNFSSHYTLVCTWFLWPKVLSGVAGLLLLPEVLTFLLLIGFHVYFPWST